MTPKVWRWLLDEAFIFIQIYQVPCTLVHPFSLPPNIKFWFVAPGLPPGISKEAHHLS